MDSFYPRCAVPSPATNCRYSARSGYRCGSYLAYGRVSDAFLADLGTAVRVAFAGEHTDALYPGTIEGRCVASERATASARSVPARRRLSGSAPTVAGRRRPRRRPAAREEPVRLVHPSLSDTSPAPRKLQRFALPVGCAIRVSFLACEPILNRCFKAEFSALTRFALVLRLRFRGSFHAVAQYLIPLRRIQPVPALGCSARGLRPVRPGPVDARTRAITTPGTHPRRRCIKASASLLAIALLVRIVWRFVSPPPPAPNDGRSRG